MFLIKQSTTITINMGPALDATDGVTPETALTPTVNLSKAGGVFAARNSVTATSHDANGYYRVELNTTDTNTVGRLRAEFTSAATHLPVWEDFMVLPANVYDSLVGGTDYLDVEVAAMAAGTVTAAAIATGAIDADAIADNAIDAGAIASGAITSAKFAAGAIDAAAIATDAIDADAIADNAIDAGAIATGAITSAKFAAGAIDAAAIATDAIDSDAIAASAVTEIQSGLGTLANQTTILAALGSWTGTGINNILGAFRAIAAKAAALTPTDLSSGTTFDNTTDSLEAVRDKAADIETDTQDIQTKIGTPAGASVSADIAVIDGIVDSILVDTGTDIPATLGTPAGASISADILTVDNLVDDLESRLGVPADLGGGATIAANLVDIESQTDDIGVAGAGLTNIGDVRMANLDATVSSRATPAQVNAEVLDVLNTDTFAEPGQGEPASTSTLVNKIGMLYKFAINKIQQTGTSTKVYAADETTVDHKTTDSEIAGVFTRGEFKTGP